jgi:hypothetical protein
MWLGWVKLASSVNWLCRCTHGWLCGRGSNWSWLCKGEVIGAGCAKMEVARAAGAGVPGDPGVMITVAVASAGAVGDLLGPESTDMNRP